MTWIYLKRKEQVQTNIYNHYLLKAEKKPKCQKEKDWNSHCFSLGTVNGGMWGGIVLKYLNNLYNFTFWHFFFFNKNFLSFQTSYQYNQTVLVAEIVKDSGEI